jgi:transposase
LKEKTRFFVAESKTNYIRHKGKSLIFRDFFVSERSHSHLDKIKGMVRLRSLALAISDVGWGMFVNFLDYKLKDKGGLLLEIDRFFPSSKTCSECLYQNNLRRDRIDIVSPIITIIQAL